MPGRCPRTLILLRSSFSAQKVHYLLRCSSSADVRRVLDIHAPRRTSRRRCGQHDNRSLSEEARRAKLLRRQLSVGTVGLDFYQASRPTSLLVWLHVTASSDRVLIASSLNLMKYRETYRRYLVNSTETPSQQAQDRLQRC